MDDQALTNAMNEARTNKDIAHINTFFHENRYHYMQFQDDCFRELCDDAIEKNDVLFMKNILDGILFYREKWRNYMLMKMVLFTNNHIPDVLLEDIKVINLCFTTLNDLSTRSFNDSEIQQYRTYRQMNENFDKNVDQPCDAWYRHNNGGISPYCSGLTEKMIKYVSMKFIVLLITNRLMKNEWHYNGTIHAFINSMTTVGLNNFKKIWLTPLNA